MIVVRSSQWSSSSLVLLLLSPSCLLLVTPEARISIPANDRTISSWPPPSDAAGRILAIQFHPLRGPSVVRLRYTIPYHRTESSTKAAAAQLLLVEYCNTQVSHLCCCCSSKLSRVSHRESSTLRPTLSSVDSRTS